MQYIRISAIFLSFGLFTTFLLQFFQLVSASYFNDVPANLFDSDMIIVPAIFGGLFLISFGIGIYQVYFKDRNSKKR